MTTAPSHLPHPASHRGVVEALLISLLAVFAAGLVLAPSGTDDSGGSGLTIGSGRLASAVRTVPEFGALDLAGTNTATVHVGSGQRVVVRADDNLLDKVTTVVRRGELVIGDRGSFRTSVGMSVGVTVPSLNAIGLSGTGDLSVDGVDTDRLLVTLSGAGTVRVSGRADWVRARMTGTGTIDLTELRYRHIDSQVTGTGAVVRR